MTTSPSDLLARAARGETSARAAAGDHLAVLALHHCLARRREDTARLVTAITTLDALYSPTDHTVLDAAASVLATAARPSQTDLLLPIRATHSCPASVTLHALTELATLRVGLIRDLLRRVRGAGHDAELWDEVLAGIDAGLHDLAGPRPAGR